MRSFFALSALALSGSLELAAATNCRPSGTTTTAAPSSSETGSSGGNKVIKNLVANGGCNELNPNDPSDIPNFYVEGGVQGVTGQGYTGDGSKEKNCASLAANATPRRKRAVGPSVAISQDLSDLDTDTFYTIQFFWRITAEPGNGACLLELFLGDNQVYMAYVPQSQPGWNRVLQRSMPSHETSAISIKMTCEGDDATILVDSIFVSDAVTPDNIDDYVLDFGDGGAQQTDATTDSVTASETAVETASETDVQTEESATETTDAATVIEPSSVSETSAAETSADETTTIAETSTAGETSAVEDTTTVEETSAAETSTAEVESTATSTASEITSASDEEASTTITSATETSSAAEEEDQTATASTSAATATDGCLPSTWDDGPVFCEPKLEVEETFCAVQGNAPSSAFELLDLSKYPWQGYAERCATICQQTEGCNVFGYTDERCAIASVNTVSDIEWDSGGDEADMMEWSNLDCFVCDETCIVTDN